MCSLASTTSHWMPIKVLHLLREEPRKYNAASFTAHHIDGNPDQHRLSRGGNSIPGFPRQLSRTVQRELGSMSGLPASVPSGVPAAFPRLSYGLSRGPIRWPKSQWSSGHWRWRQDEMNHRSWELFDED